MPEVWPILWLSLRVAAAALVLSGIIGVPIGAWLGLARFRGKALLMALVYTGMGLPPVLVGLAIYLLLSRSGPLMFLGWLFTPQALILAQTLIALPLVIAVSASAVALAPPELPLQLKSLGASDRQARWAMLREARGGIVVALAAAFGRALSEVGAALIVGGNIQGHTRTLTTALVLETGRGEFALALALGGWLLALALLVNLLVLRLHGRLLA